MVTGDENLVLSVPRLSPRPLASTSSSFHAVDWRSPRVSVKLPQQSYAYVPHTLTKE